MDCKYCDFPMKSPLRMDVFYCVICGHKEKRLYDQVINCNCRNCLETKASFTREEKEE